jgi:hypothetical protein
VFTQASRPTIGLCTDMFRNFDASYVVREFQSRFEQEDVINLENYRIYLTLLIDGMPSLPFSARTLRSSELAQLAI